jgi:splicing factor 3B subunit 3
MFLHSLTLN